MCEEAYAMKPPVSPEFRVTLHRYDDGAWISIDDTIMLSPPQQWGDHGVPLIRSHQDVEKYPLPSRWYIARSLVRPAYSDPRDSWSFAFPLMHWSRFSLPYFPLAPIYSMYFGCVLVIGSFGCLLALADRCQRLSDAFVSHIDDENNVCWQVLVMHQERRDCLAPFMTLSHASLVVCR
jgi:hypothetical protein